MCKLSTLIEPANNIPPRMKRGGLPSSFLLSCLHRRLVKGRYGKPLLLLLRMYHLNDNDDNV